jgi:hypothetical protein
MRINFVLYILCLGNFWAVMNVSGADKILSDVYRKKYVTDVVARLEQIAELVGITRTRFGHPMVKESDYNFRMLQDISKDLDFRVAILCMDPAGWEMLVGQMPPAVLNFLMAARSKGKIREGSILWKLVEYFVPVAENYLGGQGVARHVESRATDVTSCSDGEAVPQVCTSILKQACCRLSKELFALEILNSSYVRCLDGQYRAAWSRLREGLVSYDSLNQVLLWELRRIVASGSQNLGDVALIRNLLRLKKIYAVESADKDLASEEEYMYDHGTGTYVHIDESKELELLIREVVLVPEEDSPDSDDDVIVITSGDVDPGDAADCGE